MTWPLVTRMRTHVAGAQSDTFYLVWLIAWVQKSLFHLCRLPFDVPFLNYPEGWNLAYCDISPATIFMALPFSLAGGPALGYNAIVLVSFVLSGMGAYLWVYRQTRSVAAGLVAGLIYASAPHRMARWSSGHLNLLVGSAWLPFYFMSLDGLLRMRTWSWRPVVSSALLLGLIGLSTLYYLYMGGIVTVIYIAGYLLLADRSLASKPRFWFHLAAFGAIAMSLVAFSVAPYLGLGGRLTAYDRELSYVRRYSASPTDFVQPPAAHVFWRIQGRWKYQAPPWDDTLYLGIVTVALSLVALVKRRRPDGVARFLAPLVFAGVCAFLLALGTDLHWFGQSVKVAVPALLQWCITSPFLIIWLPNRYLLQLLPFYSGMRAWMRYSIFLNCFVTVLAGMGVARLVGPLRGASRGVIVSLLLLLAMVDQYPGVQAYTSVESRPVDRWLAQQPGYGAVAELPRDYLRLGTQIYYTLTHGKPWVGTYLGYPTRQYERLRPRLFRFPDDDSIASLRELGVQWAIVHIEEYKDWERTSETAELLGLRLRTTLENLAIFELSGERAQGPSQRQPIGFAQAMFWVQEYGILREQWLGQDRHPLVFGDVNGDGRSDLVCFSEFGAFVLLAGPDCAMPPKLWIRNYGVKAGGWATQEQFPRLLGDVDGDGKADVAGFGRDGVYVSLSDGRQFGPPRIWTRSFSPADGWTTQDACPRALADVNGDGKADIIGFGKDGTYVSVSTGTEFAALRLWLASFGTGTSEWASQGDSPRVLADVNGDAKADVVGFAPGGVYVALSNGTGFEPPKLWIRDFGSKAGGWATQDRYPRAVADVNGDGKADIVGFSRYGVQVSLSNGAGFDPAAAEVRNYGFSAGGWTSQNLYPRMLADVNGDGKAELLGLGAEGAYVAQYDR